jgi:uncharacterized membrane protein
MTTWVAALVLASPASVGPAAPTGPTATDAVGSDEPPLPPPPPPPPGRIARGHFTGRGWFELAAGVAGAFGLPGGRRMTIAGLLGRFGLRPHRNFGVYTGLATWPGDVEHATQTDEEGNVAFVSAAVPVIGWDVLVARGFLPVARRLELSADLGVGLGVERRPFSGRRVWGSLIAAVGLDVWLAPTMSVRFAIDHRVLARSDAPPRQYPGGYAGVSFHF